MRSYTSQTNGRIYHGEIACPAPGAAAVRLRGAAGPARADHTAGFVRSGGRLLERRSAADQAGAKDTRADADHRPGAADPDRSAVPDPQPGAARYTDPDGRAGLHHDASADRDAPELLVPGRARADHRHGRSDAHAAAARQPDRTPRADQRADRG